MVNEEQKGVKNLWQANLEVVHQLGPDYLRSARRFCALDIISSKSYEPILPQNEIILHFTNFLIKIPTLFYLLPSNKR